MKTPSRTKSIAAGLAVGALALAAPAAGSVAEPPSSSSGDTPVQLAQAQGSDQATDTVIRRDGGQAGPVVAELSPPAIVPSGGDAFDWGDAAIGAGAALFATALLMAGSSALGGRPREGKAAAAVSQGA
jgi:hypothetical protein